MKSALKQIFMKSAVANESFDDTNNIKQEEEFYNKNMCKLMQNKTSKSWTFQKVLNSNKHNSLDKNVKSPGASHVIQRSRGLINTLINRTINQLIYLRKSVQTLRIKVNLRKLTLLS